MPFGSLGAFVDALRKAGELHVVTTSVDPRLEISEITDRVVKAGGPALLFTDVLGSSFPVLTRVSVAVSTRKKTEARKNCSAGRGWAGVVTEDAMA